MSRTLKRKTVLMMAGIGLFLVFLTVFFLTSQLFSSEEKITTAPNEAMIAQAENLVKVNTQPSFDYNFDIMTEGVLQHLDRAYTYDVVPQHLNGGYLFQGIHRPPKGTTVSMDILKPATVSFFFHSRVDGGYSEIFEDLEGWKKMSPAPQYDIHNGDHGLDMTLYQFDAPVGLLSIPATTKDRACFSIVFQEK